MQSNIFTKLDISCENCTQCLYTSLLFSNMSLSFPTFRIDKADEKIENESTFYNGKPRVLYL